jgi:hypothetical protein
MSAPDNQGRGETMSLRATEKQKIQIERKDNLELTPSA